MASGELPDHRTVLERLDIVIGEELERHADRLRVAAGVDQGGDRVIADMEYRVKSAMEQSGLEREAAVAHIRRVDEARSQWSRLLYGVDWEDPRHYSAVSNLDEISEDGVCETVVRMTELDDFKPTPEDTKCFEDLRLSCKVWASLAGNPKTRSAGLEVTADDGNVLIQGTVGSTAAADLVPQIAGEVEGVKTVRSEAGMGTDWYW